MLTRQVFELSGQRVRASADPPLPLGLAAVAIDSPVQPRMLPFTAQAGCDDELDDDRARRQRLHRADDNPDRRGGRDEVYRGVVAWQWARGPTRWAPSSACGCRRVSSKGRAGSSPTPSFCCEGKCDFYMRCEKEGHYTGFRTAEESRAIREGIFVGVDLRGVC